MSLPVLLMNANSSEWPTTVEPSQSTWVYTRVYTWVYLGIYTRGRAATADAASVAADVGCIIR